MSSITQAGNAQFIKRVRLALRQGKRLQRGHVLQRPFREMVLFTHQANQLLGTTINVSLENFTDPEVLNEQVVSLEGLFSGLKKLFKSNEKASTAEPVNEEQIWEAIDYIEDAVQRYKEPGSYSPTGDTVTVAARYAPFFNGVKLANRLSQDLIQYKGLFTKSKPTLDKALQHHTRTERAFRPFIGDANRLDAFKKVFGEAVRTQPSGLLQVFKEPTHAFMGYGKTSFVNDNAFDHRDTRVTPGTPLTVHVLDKTEFKVFLGSLVDLVALFEDVSEYEADYPMGLDASDPPLRGYMGEDDELDDLVNRANFLHPVFDDNNSYFIQQLVYRLERLIIAMVHYSKQVF